MVNNPLHENQTIYCIYIYLFSYGKSGDVAEGFVFLVPKTTWVRTSHDGRHVAPGVVKNYGYALAPKIVAPHIKDFNDFFRQVL